MVPVIISGCRVKYGPNRVRATVAGDPPLTTIHAGPHTAVQRILESAAQRVFKLSSPCSWSHALVIPTPLAMVFAICQGPLRLRAWRIAGRRGTPNRMNISRRRFGRHHCFQQHMRMWRLSHWSSRSNSFSCDAKPLTLCLKNGIARRIVAITGSLELLQRLIQERTKAGLDAFRAQGRKGGTRPLDPEDLRVQMPKAMHREKRMKIGDICKTLRISPTTFYRYLEKTD